jgi:hypothetical protein
MLYVLFIYFIFIFIFQIESLSFHGTQNYVSLHYALLWIIIYIHIYIYIYNLLFKEKYNLNLLSASMMFHNTILQCHLINIFSLNPAKCLVTDETLNYQLKSS